MYDILKEMWKNPGAQYSPLPFWFWNDELDAEKLVWQLNEFHKKGVDGVVIHPRMGMSGAEYMSDEYLAIVKAVVEAAEKRHMQIVLYDEAMYPSGSAHGGVVATDKRLAARRLYALPSDEPVPEGDEVQFRIAVKLDDGRLDSVKLTPDGDHTEYNLILGDTDGTIRGIHPGEDDGQQSAPKAADLLNPYATETFINLTHEKYYAALSDHFGKTVTGIFTDEPSVTGRGAKMRGGVVWSYNLMEDWFTSGGDFTTLAALLFETKTPREKREAEHLHTTVVRRRMCESYYGVLSKWCREHKIALMGHPADSGDVTYQKYFDVPGQDLVYRMVEPGTELTSRDSVMVKTAADCARHRGLSRSSNEILGVCGKSDNPWNLPPDEMMWYLNFAFARGCSMIIPHAFYYSLRTPLQSNERPPDVGMSSPWWPDQKRLSGYIKRMSWLNTAGTNNPCAAVLCSSDYVPVTPVKELYERGYTFNYLSVDDLMEKAEIHHGELHIDRYEYKILLVDPRLRLDTDSVTKIGRFVTEGGEMYRGTDFYSYLEKHVKRTSYFTSSQPESKNIRFTHLTKSGSPFFLMINEGETDVSGKLVTDIGCAAELFDPFTGKTEPISAAMDEGGFSYDVTVPTHSAVVIGMNEEKLVSLKKEEEKSLKLWEIVSLKAEENRVKFTLPEGAARVILSADRVCEAADIFVNPKEPKEPESPESTATAASAKPKTPDVRFIFKPYRADVTSLTHPGENTLTLAITPSPANTYGKPVESGVFGLTLRIYREE